MRPRFHLAFPVRDLESTRAFYEGLLGARVGRSAERWMDFDLQGHQITAHVAPADEVPTNPVDGDQVPVRHFGLILPWEEWHAFARRLDEQGVDFLIEPHIRFRGLPGEQATLFVLDPSGNALEFKSFREDDAVFSTS